MAGFAIVGVLLTFVVVAIGEASVYQTIITTAKFDCQSDKYCEEELHGKSFHSCSHYLQPGVLFIPEEARRLQQACCYEVHKMKDPLCKWQALKETAQRVGSGLDEEMMQEVMRNAEQLWLMCRIWKQAVSWSTSVPSIWTLSGLEGCMFNKLMKWAKLINEQFSCV